MVRHLTYDRLCHVPHLSSSVPEVEVVPPHRHRPSSSVSFKHASTEGDHVILETRGTTVAESVAKFAGQFRACHKIEMFIRIYGLMIS